MTDNQYKEVVDVLANLGQDVLTPQEVEARLYQYISCKVQEFSDVALVLASNALYTPETKAVLAGNWINLVVSTEGKANLEKFFELVLSELRNPNSLESEGLENEQLN